MSLTKLAGFSLRQSFAGEGGTPHIIKGLLSVFDTKDNFRPEFEKC